MVINLVLGEATATVPRDDPMGCSWAGWDPSRTVTENWDANRGVWDIDSSNLDGEQWATMSHAGHVRLIARLTGSETVERHGRPGRVLTGEVLQSGHEVYDRLFGLAIVAEDGAVLYLSDHDTLEIDGSPVAGFLLTNNPDQWNWADDDLQEAIDTTAAGRAYRTRWSTGGRTRGITVGDRAFLMRQGTRGRGIVASGTFATEIYQDDHWDGVPGHMANYAEVDWDLVVDVDARLAFEQVAAVPDQHWRPQSSGNVIKAPALHALEELWAQHTESPRGPAPQHRRRRGGQGIQLDQALRKEIEMAAQERLTRVFHEDGWTVADTHTTEPSDARAARDGEIRYLEAKGTTTAGESVIVTRGEVEFAREHPGECVIGIVSGMRVGDDGHIVPDSGDLRWFTWSPSTSALRARTYDFYPTRETGKP